MGDIIIYIVGSFLGIVLIAWIFSWFFRPSKRNKYLEYQINVLNKIAEKQGVDRAELEKIYKEIFI